LPGSKSLNKVIPVTTEELFNSDFYPGLVAVIKSSGFVNSSSIDYSDISERLVRDFFIEILQTGVVQKEFNV
jgi:hypothetical protein